MSLNQDIATKQDDLLESFLLDSWETLSQFEALLFDLDDTAKLKSISVLTHRIRGTAALYGFEQISKLAELMEQILEKSDRFSNEHIPDLQTLLQQFAACLSRGLEQIALDGQEGQVGIQFTALGGAKVVNQLLRENPQVFVEEVEETTQSAKNLSQLLQNYYQSHQEDWSFFAPEAYENIEAIKYALDDAKTIDLSDQEQSDRIINTLFRSTHTLKGAAYMVGLDPMGDLAHQLEDVMVKVQNHELELSHLVLDSLRSGSRVLDLMLETAQGSATDLEDQLDHTQKLLKQALGLESEDASVESSDARQKTNPYKAFEAYYQSFYTDNQDVWEYFAPELDENLEAATDNLIKLSDNLEDEEALHIIFRAMHTIKGAAYMVEFEDYGHIAADLEKICRRVQEAELNLDDQILELLDQGVYVLKSLMKLAAGETTDSAIKLIELCEALEPFLEERKCEAILPIPEEDSSAATAENESSTKSASETKRVSMVRVSSDKLDALMDIAGEVLTLRNRMNQQLEQLAQLNGQMEASRNRMLRTVTDFEAQYINPQMASAAAQDESAKQQISSQQALNSNLSNSLQDVFDELEFDTYNDLNILARSVSEMSNDVTEIQDQLNDFFYNVKNETDKLQFLSRQLRSEISRARMVPISQLYGLLKRLLQNSSDKAYVLETTGENVELDNTVLESVSDSLLHLVRNAVVHGIESQEERLAKGKAAEGKLSLRAYPKGSHVFIEVEDDGAGIDVEALKRKAVERGFRTQEEVDALTDTEAQQLIFIAGLSTAKELSTTAGRGVGMDAVAESVRRLNGEIILKTELGKGTRFSLKLPLTLLISDALMIEVAGQTFGFASDNIETLQTLEQSAAELVQGKRHIRYRDKMLELHNMRALFGFPEAPATELFSVVIVRTEQQLLAFEVDKHLDLEEIVVRELNPILHQLKYISNVTVATNGDIVPLLDPIGLANLNQTSIQQRRRRATTVAVEKKVDILLVDDSVSVRRVISKMLGRANYNVTTAGDGKEALERFLQGEKFDMVLSDLEMPLMNGYELLEELRHRPDSRDIPIIIMTTRAGDKHRKLALELGANHYFSKPIDENRLIQKIKELSQSTNEPSQADNEPPLDQVTSEVLNDGV